MLFNLPTLVLLILLGIGVAIATPVLAKGFMRRGKGVKYEQSFILQRAPQFASVVTIFLLIFTGMVSNDIIQIPGAVPFVTLSASKAPEGFPLYLSWFGLLIFIDGLIFMIGGWISLGEMFSTDAEVMENHTVRDTGLLAFVMHPAYSGIIQSLLGASVVLASPFCILFTIFMVAPLWLKRAKYEESLLLEALGEPYREYGQKMGWRRLVPRFIPIGV